MGVLMVGLYIKSWNRSVLNKILVHQNGHFMLFQAHVSNLRNWQQRAIPLKTHAHHFPMGFLDNWRCLKQLSNDVGFMVGQAELTWWCQIKHGVQDIYGLVVIMTTLRIFGNGMMGLKCL